MRWNPRRIALLCLVPLLLLAAMMVVARKRSWQPRTIPVGNAGGGNTLPAPLPIAWRGDTVWLLRGSAGVFSRRQPYAPSRWQALRNWNGEDIMLCGATPFAGNVAGPDVSAVSSSGRTLARSWGSAKIQMWPLPATASRPQRTLVEPPLRNRLNLQQPGVVLALTLSPDGSRLAATSHLYGLYDYEELQRGFNPMGVVLFDARTGRKITRQSAVTGNFTHLSFSPDGRHLAGTTSDGHVFLLDGRTGRKQRVWRAHPMFAAQAAWSPDGKLLATGANPRLGETPTHIQFHLRWGAGMGGGQMSSTITARGDNNERAVLRTDSKGNSTFNGQSDRSLRLWDARTGKRLQLWNGGSGITSLEFSPDGSQLAAGTHGQALLFDLKTWRIARRFTLPGTANAPYCMAFSPDGATLAVSAPPLLALFRLK